MRAELGAKPIILMEEDLQRIENTIGHSLPADYREFWKDYGGYGVCGFFQFSTPYHWEEGGGISVFYGLMPEEPCLASGHRLYAIEQDILSNYKWFHKQLPPELLCIGDAGGGHRTCIAVAGGNKGSVYYWDRVEPTTPDSYANIPLVARSFDEFMQLLMTEDEFEAQS